LFVEAGRRTIEGAAGVSFMSKEIELLEEIFELVSRSDPPRALLEDVLGKVLAFLDYQTGAVHLLDEEAGVFRLEAHRGVPDVLVERFREAPRQSRIIGHIIDEEKALFVKDGRIRSSSRAG
jgi:hypothetical protein